MQPFAPSPHFDAIIQALRQQRLSVAIEHLRQWADALPAGDYTSQIDALASNYKQLLSYFAAGYDDPTRTDMIGLFCRQASDIAESLRRAERLLDAHSLYAIAARSVEGRTLTSLADLYTKADQLLMFQSLTASDDSPTTVEARQHCDAQLARLFAYFWTSPLWNAAQRDEALAFFCDQTNALSMRLTALSGLILALNLTYDRQRLACLVSIYASGVPVALRGRALVAIALCVVRHRHVDDETLLPLLFVPDFETAWNELQYQLLLQQNAKEASQQLADSILPTLREATAIAAEKLKEGLRPDLDSLNELFGEEFASCAQDFHEQFSELHRQGCDFGFTSFCALKSFPFFTDIHHWFQPFDPKHPAMGIVDNNIALMAAQQPVCDSDKYSMAIAMTHARQAHNLPFPKDMQLTDNDNVLPAPTLAHVCRLFLQDLYRFFCVYRHRDEFVNPFSGSCLLHEPTHDAADTQRPAHFSASPLCTLIAESAIMRSVRILANQKRWDDCHSLLSLPAAEFNAEPQLLKIRAYVAERRGGYDEAITLYEKLLTNTADAYTLRKLANCHLQTGHYDEAACAFDHLFTLTSDTRHLFQLGHAYLSAGRADLAANAFRNHALLTDNCPESLEALAYALYANGQAEEAIPIYQQLEEIAYLTLDNNTIRNIAHAYAATGNFSQAIAYYRRTLTADDTLSPIDSDDRAILANVYNIPNETLLLIEESLRIG